MSADKQNFAMWLDTTMDNRGISGNKLAEMMNTDAAAISRWRNGHGLPRMETLYRLGRVLGVDPIRLAVTAGVLTPEETNKRPYPVPAPLARMDKVTKELSRVKGLTEDERSALINFYKGMHKS
jgi:transcriptional regulator with XRE-family HTH domain